MRAIALLAGAGALFAASWFAVSASAQITGPNDLLQPALPSDATEQPSLASEPPAEPVPVTPQERKHEVPKELSDKVQEAASHGDFAKAIALITEALAKDADNAELYRLRATMQCRAANMKLCLEDAGKAVEADKDYAPAYLFRALARIDANQTKDAMEDCEATIRLWNDRPQGYNCRGLAHRALREYPLALADFDGALVKEPKFSLAPYNKGMTYLLMKQPDDAIASFSAAIAINDKFDDAFAQRGKVRIGKGDAAGARADFAKALSLNRGNHTAAVGIEALQVGKALDALAGGRK